MLEVFQMFKMYGTGCVVPWQRTYRGRPRVWSHVCRWKKRSVMHFVFCCHDFLFFPPGFCLFCIAAFLPFCSLLFPLYRDCATHGLCYTKKLVQTDAFTQTLFHTNPFKLRLRYTQPSWHAFITKTVQYHDAANDRRYLIFPWYFQWNSPKQLSTMMLQMTRYFFFHGISHEIHQSSSAPRCYNWQVLYLFFMVFPMKFTKAAQYHDVQMTRVKQNSSLPSSM